MKVNTAMTRNVRLVNHDQTIREAAQLMAEIDAGSLPVGENDRLVGMITDRDIAIRAVAEGKSPDTKIREVMTQEMLYCFDDQDLDEVSRNMAKNQVRRLPVINHSKRLVGILSLGDLARKEDPAEVGRTMSRVATPSRKHSQTAINRQTQAYTAGRARYRVVGAPCRYESTRSASRYWRTCPDGIRPRQPTQPGPHLVVCRLLML